MTISVSGSPRQDPDATWFLLSVKEGKKKEKKGEQKGINIGESWCYMYGK
jgi:hypothetical protein